MNPSLPTPLFQMPSLRSLLETKRRMPSLKTPQQDQFVLNSVPQPLDPRKRPKPNRGGTQGNHRESWLGARSFIEGNAFPPTISLLGLFDDQERYMHTKSQQQSPRRMAAMSQRVRPEVAGPMTGSAKPINLPMCYTRALTELSPAKLYLRRQAFSSRPIWLGSAHACVPIPADQNIAHHARRTIAHVSAKDNGFCYAQPILRLQEPVERRILSARQSLSIRATSRLADGPERFSGRVAFAAESTADYAGACHPPAPKFAALIFHVLLELP